MPDGPRPCRIAGTNPYNATMDLATDLVLTDHLGQSLSLHSVLGAQAGTVLLSHRGYW